MILLVQITKTESNYTTELRKTMITKYTDLNEISKGFETGDSPQLYAQSSPWFHATIFVQYEDLWITTESRH